ncbi:MAG: ABC transporter substrate-binding protein [Pleurocapsa sp.]
MDNNNLTYVSKLAIGLTSSFLWFCLAVGANAETTLEKIQRTGTLKVAIREDAAPFGYIDDNNNLQGYCLDFVALLEKQLTEKLSRNTIIIRLLKSKIDNRFALVAKDLVYLECGPNTIRDDVASTVQFSTDFFITGTQFLVKKNNPKNIDLDSNLENIKIGVLTNTTTAESIANKYPLAQIIRFRGANGRNRGIQELQQGKIDAMVSEGILLRATAQKQGLSQQEYPLIPDTPLTCDRYGMILTAPDEEWKNFVDSVINSPEAKRIFNSWFGELTIDTDGGC